MELYMQHSKWCKAKNVVFAAQQKVEISAVLFPSRHSCKESAYNAGDAGDVAQSLYWENPLEEELATLPRVLAWRIPWTEEPGGLQSLGSQRVVRDWAHMHGNLNETVSSIRANWFFCPRTVVMAKKDHVHRLESIHFPSSFGLSQSLRYVLLVPHTFASSPPLQWWTEATLGSLYDYWHIWILLTLWTTPSFSQPERTP